VHIPDVRGREAIFKVHARNKPVAADVDFQVLARITSGFSGADIENLLNEAAILCARDNRTLINMNDINEGINKVILGPQKKSRLVTEADKRITAYHEVGHAIVGKVCKHCGPVHEVSIIPRGAAGGYTMSRPEDDNQYESVNKLSDHLARIMGGRAAEEIVIQDVTSGAVGDFKTATDLAKKMVMEWGMSGNKRLGKVFYGSNQEVFLGRDYQSTHNYSEATASEIDQEINRITDEAYKRALEILSKHRKEMDVMARVLLECETIYTEEVDMIMEGKSFEEVRDGLGERLKKKYEKPAAVTAAAQ
jgi:cell division protease FtsH